MKYSLIRLVFHWLGIGRMYDVTVVQDRLTDVRSKIRQDLDVLLRSVNQNNPAFAGVFSDFLQTVESVDDDTFFEKYAQLPTYSKQDYADSKQSILPQSVIEQMAGRELPFDGKPLQFLTRLRKGGFIMPMATGGSTSTPLAVQMTKQHMFSMLFTFFKCWYRMGWRPGDKILVFYPGNTYNIDEMASYNRFSAITGFQIHLFSKLDTCSVQHLVSVINKYQPALLLVFPSTMNIVANTIRKHGLKLTHHPALINVSGETLFDCQRNNIEEVFAGSSLENSYGSVEVGEIAHETTDGLEIFAKFAYVETELNEQGQPEMIITRLGLTDFPFIRYKMRDVAEVDFKTRSDGTQRFILSRIEGKDTNYILSRSGQHFYPSFFNRLVNDLNEQFNDDIVEIKVYEQDQIKLEIKFIVKSVDANESIRVETRRLLNNRIGSDMVFDIKFVEFIDHDYRRKYRVIERIGDIEYAGGIVGDSKKLAQISKDASEQQ